jgi:hypothetical protein
MSDGIDLLFALRNVGVDVPADGDPGDARVRRSVQRAIDGKSTGQRRRLRLPFGRRSIALLPTALLVTVATAAAAGTVGLLTASPTNLFKHNPGFFGVPHTPQTVIPSTVRRITTFEVPGLGHVQYWIGATRQHGLCQAMRLPNKTWAVMPGTVGNAGTMPGCGPTRRQQVIAQGNSRVGLLPMSVDEQSISLKGRSGEWLDVYYGVVDANGAAGVIDPRNRRTAPLINGRYFVMVVPLGRFHRGICMGCENLRAINATGTVLPANYGPMQYRNH